MLELHYSPLGCTMSTIVNAIKTAGASTAEQLLAMQDDGYRYELIEGVLHMMSPAGSRHGRITMRLGSILEQYVRANGLGAVFAAETGFFISRNPDTVRAPDVAFVRKEKMDPIGNCDGYLPLAPDLAIEVVSPNDSSTQVETKVRMWIESGTAMVLVVDPATRTVRVYRTKDSIDVLTDSDELDASDVVSGWKLAVGECFS
jgi:Uma2 family endonuclease